jgi:Ca-activated chloride channel family protein
MAFVAFGLRAMLALRPTEFIPMSTSKYKNLIGFYLVLTVIVLLTISERTGGQAQSTAGPQATEARILLTAFNKDGHFVSTLQADDLRILQDGKPRKILGFRQMTDRNVSVAILIDASASQERSLPTQKLAATSFAETIIHSDRDQAAVATFTGTLTVEQKLTNDIVLLRQAIARAKFVPPPGWVRGGLVIGRPPPVQRTPAGLAAYTAVWDSVIEACTVVLAPSSGDARRAIILLTDGQDTISKSKMTAAVDRAVRDGVAIYAIGIGDTAAYGIDQDALRKLSERTGGRAFFPKHSGDLGKVFAEIGEALRTQYQIVYDRVDTTSGKIRIELMNPALHSAGVQLYYQQVAPNN